MSGILAFTIFITIFAISEIIALKTKATLSTVFVAGFILLIGFWTGLPMDIYEKSAIVPIAAILIGVLITGMGNMLDFNELKRQWKTVAISTITVIMATTTVYLIGQFIIGKDLALAGAPIFAGGSTASIIMSKALTENGKADLALFVILMLVFQSFVGIPVASQFLKKAAKNFLGNKEEHSLYEIAEEIEIEKKEKRGLLQLPKSFNTSSMTLAKLGMVTALAFYVSQAIDGKINYIVLALVFGTIFTELGFLEKGALEKSKANGFILFSAIMLLFTNLPKAKPEQLLNLIFPLGVALGVGVIGAIIAGAIVGKIFKVETCMAICMCLTCMFGFPTTMFMADEVAVAIGKDPREVELLGNYLRPKMITAGFITGILSIVLAGYVAGLFTL